MTVDCWFNSDCLVNIIIAVEKSEYSVSDCTMEELLFMALFIAWSMGEFVMHENLNLASKIIILYYGQQIILYLQLLTIICVHVCLIYHMHAPLAVLATSSCIHV